MELTPDFEACLNNGNLDNADVGDQLVREGYGSTGDKAIMDIIEANAKLVETYSKQICDHYSTVLERVPESMQAAYIDSIRMFSDPNDVVYKGMVNRFDNRVPG